MHALRFAAIAAALALPAAAQFTHVIPNGFAAVEGNSSNTFPWSSSSATWPGLHTTSLYDSSNFTAASINYPILIQRLRWRANGSTATWAGGVFQTATIRLATAALDYASVSSTFANNLGPDLTTVFNGPATYLGTTGNGTGVPGPWVVDVTLTIPFVYDPAAGDLCIDVENPNTSWGGGSTTSLDIDASPTTLASRVYASTNYPLANGITVPHGVVVEVTYLPAQGAAMALPYGSGCPSAAASFYESFAAGTFDLSNTSLQMLPTGGGYVVVPLGGSFVAPTSANLALGNDSVSAAKALPFAFPYPGGSTSAIHVASNGFVWLQANTATGCCNGSAGQLLSQPPRFAPLWTDLNPAAVGSSVHFELDASNTTARVTWVAVPENGQSNSNTFQLALHSDGRVDYLYQGCAVTAHTALAGWSPGNNARDPGPIDLSVALPIVTAPDQYPLQLAGQRPVLGTTATLTTSQIPASTPVGLVGLGFQQISTGVPLAALGAPGCFQNAGVLGTVVFLPAGAVGLVNLAVPLNQALAGLHVYGQSLTLSPGFNQLGVLTSNGLDLLLNPQ